MSCHVIITFFSLAWTLLSVTTCLLTLTAIVTPKWLIGVDKRLPTLTNDTAVYLALPRPSIGIYNRCTLLHHLGVRKEAYSCGPYASGIGAADDEFPVAWQACLVLMGIAGCLLAITAASAVLSLCIRSVCKKSIFTISGLIQCIAGILLTMAVVVYPVGWASSQKLQSVLYCGDVAAFDPGTCELGWAMYVAIIGTALAYVTGVLAVQADKATSRDAIENEMLIGKHLICVL